MLQKIKDAPNPEQDILNILGILHAEGASNPEILERLTFYKEFHPQAFSAFEEKIISALGLFYKIDSPDSLYSFLMSGFGRQHVQDYGSNLTPVQASIRRAVDEYQFTSISAPTSVGKSYSIRDFIVHGTGDAVIVVPSRALIAEYMNAMQRKFAGDKNVMISSFVDLVFTSRQLRRIFVLTPERSKELYKVKEKINVQVFFFDEAQISDEGRRGIIFDVTVRRIKKHFPAAKLIFAHPFVENPDAQFSKHNISLDAGYARSYSYGSVGRICVFLHGNCKYYYFSPHSDAGHKIKNCVEFEGSFKDFAFTNKKSILIYVSKNAIYRGDFADEFQDYIDSLPVLTDSKALEIIQSIRSILGADNSQHKSNLVELLKKGVVIHHGSIPLEVRFLIEDFIRNGFSPLCFATSTLAQGINMPFDIVWLDNNRFDGSESDRALSFKNLIGRAGRLTDNAVFDYGHVYTNNPKLFSERIKSSFKLNPGSIIDTAVSTDKEPEEKELIEAIRNDTFNDDMNIPMSKAERLSNSTVLEYAQMFLDIFYHFPEDIKMSIGGKENRNNRSLAKSFLRNIYEASLNRQLYDGELYVFNQAIDILFHAAQGRSFKEIVGIRYNQIVGRDDANVVEAQFSQPANKLPDSTLKWAFSIFKPGTSVYKVSYDAIVFDTYDYLDQVISFSLSDTFIAAFLIYKANSNDARADKIIDLLRYGTNSAILILLMRYGLPPEAVGEIEPYISSVNEADIVFNSSIESAPSRIKEMIEWFLPA